MRFPARTLGNPGACSPHLARARLNSHCPRLSGGTHAGIPSARIESPRTATPATPPGDGTSPLFATPPARQNPASSTSTRFPAAARSRSSRAPQAPHDTCVRSSSVSRLPHRTHCRDVYAAGTPATVQSPLRTEISSRAFRNIPGAPFFKLRFMPRLPRPRPRIFAWSRSSTTMQRPGRTMRDAFFRHSCRFFNAVFPRCRSSRVRAFLRPFDRFRHRDSTRCSSRSLAPSSAADRIVTAPVSSVAVALPPASTPTICCNGNWVSPEMLRATSLVTCCGAGNVAALQKTLISQG